MEQDTEPAACLASRTREAGGHRPFPLRGVADSSAETAQVNGGEIRRDQRNRNLLRQGVRDAPVHKKNGPPAKSPVMARREALRWVKADVSAGSHRMDYPSCAFRRVIPLTFRGENQGSPIRAMARQGRRVRAANFSGRGCLTWWMGRQGNGVAARSVIPANAGIHSLARRGENWMDASPSANTNPEVMGPGAAHAFGVPGRDGTEFPLP